MQIWFNPARGLEGVLRQAASGEAVKLDDAFAPDVRVADPRFGDFQANGALPYAKERKINPREIATRLTAALEAGALDRSRVDWAIAGPGFINFTLQPAWLLDWMRAHDSAEALRAGAAGLRGGERVVIDYSSPNTAKEMHVGHIRSTFIGEAIARLLEFCGAGVIRDNHIGDWGTQFGMIIWAIKHEGYDLSAPRENPVAELQELYGRGNVYYKSSEAAADEVRAELVKLQEGDPENTRIWNEITRVSWETFNRIYTRLGIRFDEVLGESFYRDKVDRVYAELAETGIAELNEGALVVFHPEHKRFATQPFIVRKADGASNYASTDLATVLHRVEHFKATEVLYVVGAPQADHFEQLFITVRKWFEKKGYPLPQLKHVAFGSVLGNDGRPFRTREGGSVKLRDLLDEAEQRALALVNEKSADLPEDERRQVARAVGLGAVRYADLSQNRTSDYMFSWDKMLSLEGNTAPYLLYAIARIQSIFRKAGLRPGEAEAAATPFETPEELALARKLVGFGPALEMALGDLRPHFLCAYVYDLAGVFSTFYNANRVMVDDPAVKARRLVLCARTLLVLQTCMDILGLETLERM